MHREPRRTTTPVNWPFESERARDVSTLWVTGPSPELRQKLLRIYGLPPTMIVRPEMPADTELLPNNTLNLIADVILYRDVRWIVVCGQPGDAPSRAQEHLGSPQNGLSSYDQMLQRMCDRLERQQLVQERVCTQLHQIRSNARAALALKSHAANLCGMFYIPESDAFLIYDDAENQFVPITDARVRHR